LFADCLLIVLVFRTLAFLCMAFVYVVSQHGILLNLEPDDVVQFLLLSREAWHEASMYAPTIGFALTRPRYGGPMSLGSWRAIWMECAAVGLCGAGKNDVSAWAHSIHWRDFPWDASFANQRSVTRLLIGRVGCTGISVASVLAFASKHEKFAALVLTASGEYACVWRQGNRFLQLQSERLSSILSKGGDVKQALEDSSDSDQSEGREEGDIKAEVDASFVKHHLHVDLEGFLWVCRDGRMPAFQYPYNSGVRVPHISLPDTGVRERLAKLLQSAAEIA